MKIHRWLKVEALVAVDDTGWVRGVIVPDGYRNGQSGTNLAQVFDGGEFRLSESETPNTLKRWLSKAIRSAK